MYAYTIHFFSSSTLTGNYYSFVTMEINRMEIQLAGEGILQAGGSEVHITPLI